jgi:hypothetical protein
MGANLKLYNYTLNYDSLDKRITGIKKNFFRPSFFIQNQVSVNKNLKITAGLQASYPTNIQNIFINPRCSFNYRINDNLNLKFAWGKYRQYDIKTSLTTSSVKYEPYWIMSSKELPVINSNHFVSSLTYRKNFFSINFDAFSKNTEGHSRIKSFADKLKFNEGKSKSKGFDIYMKATKNQFTGWIAYSYSRTFELFDYYSPQEYLRALQDQRHEIKSAIIADFNPIYFSASYSFGTGLPVYNDNQNIIAEPNYNRMDASIIWKMPIKRIKTEFGIKFQNIFGADNITSGEYEIMPWYKLSSVSLYTETVPSSFRFYFNAEF